MSLCRSGISKRIKSIKLMKLTKTSIGGIEFFYREGFSDIKTFIEVLSNQSYLKKGMEVLNNESWLDCGGNVGAFSLLAASKGASVITLSLIHI